jgi:hypothetical protein
VLYVNALVSDWNYSLNSYINSLNKKDIEREMLYSIRFKIKAWKYYHRVDVWTIKHIINDPFLLTDVHNHIQGLYKP